MFHLIIFMVLFILTLAQNKFTWKDIWLEDFRPIAFNYIIKPEIRHGGVITEGCRIKHKTAVVVVALYRCASRDPICFKALGISRKIRFCT